MIVTSAFYLQSRVVTAQWFSGAHCTNVDSGRICRDIEDHGLNRQESGTQPDD